MCQQQKSREILPRLSKNQAMFPPVEFRHNHSTREVITWTKSLTADCPRGLRERRFLSQHPFWVAASKKVRCCAKLWTKPSHKPVLSRRKRYAIFPQPTGFGSSNRTGFAKYGRPGAGWITGMEQGGRAALRAAVCGVSSRGVEQFSDQILCGLHSIPLLNNSFVRFTFSLSHFPC